MSEVRLPADELISRLNVIEEHIRKLEGRSTEVTKRKLKENKSGNENGKEHAGAAGKMPTFQHTRNETPRATKKGEQDQRNIPDTMPEDAPKTVRHTKSQTEESQKVSRRINTRNKTPHVYTHIVFKLPESKDKETSSRTVGGK